MKLASSEAMNAANRGHHLGWLTARGDFRNQPTYQVIQTVMGDMHFVLLQEGLRKRVCMILAWEEENSLH